MQLLALTPGVIAQGSGGQFGMTQLQFSAPGTTDDRFNYSLDGGTNNDTFYDLSDTYPNPDALQEFTVNTRGVSATLGRGSTEVGLKPSRAPTNFTGARLNLCATMTWTRVPSSHPPPRSLSATSLVERWADRSLRTNFFSLPLIKERGRTALRG